MNQPFELSSISQYSARALAGLGALGVALQNYQAVAIFISGLASGAIPASRLLNWSIQIAALGAGGLCSGMVNYWMNVGLLDDFFERMTSEGDYQYKQLTAWQKIQYFGGIFVFVVTGVLFGLMTFAFAMEGPLAMLSVAAGLCVAIIMTIQEVETWLSSYNKDAVPEEPLTELQLLGKWAGHFIAGGNVLALSLLFTLSLAQVLIALQVAALPALIAGFSVAFTFGAFTEYYFYNFYLSNFCKDFGENWMKMMAIEHAWFGVLCSTTNAFVNGALTYAGVKLLTGLFLAANIALPPVAFIIALASISAVFAGSASFVLGLDFWIRQNSPPPQMTPVKERVSFASHFGVFAAANEDMSGNPLGEWDIDALCVDHVNHCISIVNAV